MEFKLYSIQTDTVIDAFVVMGETTYGEAIQHLFPLINKFDSQRKIQDKKFYEKLKRDISDGCVIPPITIAFIDSELPSPFNIKSALDHISKNISNGFILDGIQRLNTLKRAFDENALDLNKGLFFNAIFCTSEDKLLYRMITLNNGQRPMTPRHQVEVMMRNVLHFSEDLSVQTEKERSRKIVRGSFNFSDIVQAYLAFITNSIHIDNAKIIDEKMDQLLVGKILENDPKNYTVKLEQVINLIVKFSEHKELKEWLKNTNNLIGFCVGISGSFSIIEHLNTEDFWMHISKFEDAFAGLDKSKIKLGKVRKQLVRFFISGISKLKYLDELELLDILGQEIES